jgi:PD-(D/E)XK endonuclease
MGTRHHTKDKGDLAVAKVHADLVDRGAIVLLPLTEHAPFDLVAYLDGAFYRVQVKFRSATNGRVTVEFSSSWADRHGSHHRPMPRDEVDAVAVYCPDTMQTYYLNPSNFRTRVNMRLEPARNGQRLRIVSASAFLMFPPARPASPDVDAGSLAEGAA